MIWLRTTNGYDFRISDMDEARVRKHRWRAEISKTSGKPYIRCTIKREGISATLYLHRLITGCPGTMKVDHRDNETLHNDRPNLRIATHNQNNFNRTGWSVAGFKGVSLDRTRWRARITLDGIVNNLGTFRKKEEAAKAYDAAAYRLYGEFAWLNFPEDYPLPLSDIPF